MNTPPFIGRGLREVVLNIHQIRTDHATLLAAAVAQQASPDDLEKLAGAEDELHRYLAMCTGFAGLCLMSLGYRWDDELHHPAAPKMVARVRLADNVELDGEIMSIMDASKRVAKQAQRGVALGDWSSAFWRLGDLAGLGPTSTALNTKKGLAAPKEAASPQPENYRLF